MHDSVFQDPFGEKRGQFDYKSILKRLEKIKMTVSEKQSVSSDEESSDTDLETTSSDR